MASSADTVAAIMSRRVVGVPTDCDLSVAGETLARSSQRHLVVVDAGRVVRGILSAEQVLLALGTTGRGDRVGDQVSGEPVSIRPSADIRRAAELMLDTLVDAVLVADGAGRVLGVLTWADIVAHSGTNGSLPERTWTPER